MLGAAGITLDHSPMRHMLNLETVITYEGTESIHELDRRPRADGARRVLRRASGRAYAKLRRVSG